MSLSHDRYCTEIVVQTGLVRSLLTDAEPSAPVPSCPAWTLADLLRHLGNAHRRVASMVRDRITEPVTTGQTDDTPADAAHDPAALGTWLTAGAAILADTLRTVGRDATMWTPVPEQSPAFWARRMTQETVVHRADVALTVDAEFTVTPDLATDAVDEWMTFGSLPMVLEYVPQMRELLGTGNTLHFHTTDTAAEWLVDLTGNTPTWRHAHEKATVAVRGPLTDVLLAIYRRRKTPGDTVEVLGDAELLESWLDATGFWMRRP